MLSLLLLMVKFLKLTSILVWLAMEEKDKIA